MPDPRILRGPARLRVKNASYDKHIHEIKLKVRPKNSPTVYEATEPLAVEPQAVRDRYVEVHDAIDDLGFSVSYTTPGGECFTVSTNCVGIHANVGAEETELTLDQGGGLLQVTVVLPDASPPYEFFDYSNQGVPCEGSGG